MNRNGKQNTETEGKLIPVDFPKAARADEVPDGDMGQDTGKHIIDIEEGMRDLLRKELNEHFDDLENPYVEAALSRFSVEEINELRSRKMTMTWIPSFPKAISMALDFPAYFSMNDILHCLDREITADKIKNKPHLNEYGDMFGGLDRIALSDAGISPDGAKNFYERCFRRFNGAEIARAKALFGRKYPGITFAEIIEIVASYSPKFQSIIDIYNLYIRGINPEKAGKLSNTNLRRKGIDIDSLRK
ncbi:MAG: hypothetical protein WC269_01945 [Candidatus Gracilibacteria bacterium]|jgi:hypothetical protein